MAPRPPEDPASIISLRPVGPGNWRGVAALAVTPSQRDFVAEPTYYLALCCYGTSGWRPLAVHQGEVVVGFLMWAEDESDGSCWLGGVLIDREWQGRGYGKEAVRTAIAMLAQEYGYRRFALSYRPDNVVAKQLYTRLGFEETGEIEGDEVVARLRLST